MGKAGFKLKGMKELLRNFDKEVQKIENRTHRGLIEAVILIQREAEPGTPIDTGNLRASFFIASYKGPQEPWKTDEFKNKKGDNKNTAAQMRAHHQKVQKQASQAAKSIARAFQPVVLFGYSASYAPFVHENTEANFKREGAKARWFYSAIRSKQSEALEVIRKRARIV